MDNETIETLIAVMADLYKMEAFFNRELEQYQILYEEMKLEVIEESIATIQMQLATILRNITKLEIILSM